MMDDIEAQKDEILVLQSIFDESQIHVNCSSGQDIVGCIHIKPVNEKLNVQANKDGLLQQFFVDHLCPIELHFNIPVNYPSVTPPNFTLVCKWLRRDQVNKTNFSFTKIFHINSCAILIIYSFVILALKTLSKVGPNMGRC